MKDKGLKSFMVNEVHDSVIIEEAPEEHEIMQELSETCMTEKVVEYLKQVFDINYNYPLAIDQETHSHWSWNKPTQ